MGKQKLSPNFRDEERFKFRKTFSKGGARYKTEEGGRKGGEEDFCWAERIQSESRLSPKRKQEVPWSIFGVV